VIVTPGPDTAVTIRNTLTGGRAGGIATALGVAIGQAIWALATSVGIVALLVTSEPLFLAVKYLGAAYLIWLGLQSLRAAVRPAAGANTLPADRSLTPRAAFAQGILSDLSNPKMAVFFTSLLPQFAPAHGTSFAALALLGLLFSLLTLFWLVSYTVAIARIGTVLRRPSVRRSLEGITGAALIGLGVKLASDHR
jgi:RhtB (resistance to homoserine/threonine) family protein